ncbi:MAG: aminoacyl-tRNA hydrolase [Corynebacterium sp.]|nr:aminoacyl-tRNA hydrolase [Corynebacterium sp.]
MVIGLGNPGVKYAGTRHNVGYLVTDELLERAGDVLRPMPGTKAHVARVEVDGHGVLLVRSTTFMNLSGEAVAPLATSYGISPDHVVVVHDELDLPAGKVKVKLGGNENGHNGLKSITGELGTRDYVRVRVGIGRPASGTGVVEHVLTALDGAAGGDAAAPTGADAVDVRVTRGPAAAQNEIHSRP